MKKFFTLMAVTVMALTMNAETISFAALTQEDVTIGNPSLWTWGTSNSMPSLSYIGDNSEMQYITIKGIKFGTKRGESNHYYRLYEAGLYANGTNTNIIVSGLKNGQEVTFTLQGAHTSTATTISAVSGCSADASNPESAPAGGDFTAFKFIATGSEMTIKNGGSRFILSTIEIGEAPAGSDAIEEVSATTTWTLTGAEDGAKLNTENVVNYQNSGLFLRSNNADGSHSVSAAAVEASGTFSNGYAWSATQAFQCPGAGLSESGVNGKAANSAPASGNDRCVAFKAAANGTVYVAMTTTSYKTDRELYIWSSEGEKVASVASNDASVVTVNAGAGADGGDTYTYHYVELKAEVKSGVSYFIGGSNQVRVACIQFIKQGDPVPTTIQSMKYETVSNGKWYNLQGQEVVAPTKGIFIHNGKKLILK